MLEKQIENLIERYLAQKVDRSGFAEEFAGLYFQARNDRNVSREARRFCDSIVLPFAEVSRGHRSESSFREELTRIARPFAHRPLNPRFEISVPSQNPVQVYFLFGECGPIRKPPEMGTDSRIDPTRRLVMAS
jgi:hypothetical protein